MRVHAEKQRAVNLVLLSIQANRLADGEDVPFVEGLVERGAAMPGGAESHPLRGHGRVGHLRVIGRDEPGHVHQHCWLAGFPARGLIFASLIRHLA